MVYLTLVKNLVFSCRNDYLEFDGLIYFKANCSFVIESNLWFVLKFQKQVFSL